MSKRIELRPATQAAAVQPETGGSSTHIGSGRVGPDGLVSGLSPLRRRWSDDTGAVRPRTLVIGTAAAAAVGVGVAGLATGVIPNPLDLFSGSAPTADQSKIVPGVASKSPSPDATIAPTVEPTSSTTPDKENPATAGVGVEYKHFTSGQEVQVVRGGDADKWKELSYEDTVTLPGSLQATKVNFSEWVYTGPMSDLNENYRIPQSQQDAAAKIGGNVRAEDVHLIKIFDKGTKGYSDWMDKWLSAGVKPGKDGMVIGYELVQHGRQNGDIDQFKVNLPQGWITEYYYDNSTDAPGDDYAATIWNPYNATGAMKITMSGGTFWPWGAADKIAAEQSNYLNKGAQGEKQSYIYTDPTTNKDYEFVIQLGVGTNINNGVLPSFVYEINQETGLATRTGMVIRFVTSVDGTPVTKIVDLDDKPYSPTSK